jgi:hypothetical protein
MSNDNNSEFNQFILSKLSEMMDIDKTNHETTLRAFEHLIDVVKLLDERITKLEER